MTDDTTLAGYLKKHERPPAFGGSDGAAYSVGVYVDEQADAEGRYGAALIFVRWSEGGDQPVGHLESECLAFGATEKEAKKKLLQLTLHQVKAHLELAIAAKADPPE